MADGTRPEDNAPSKRGVVAVLLLSFVLYLPSVLNGFAMDDDPIARSEYNQQPGQPDPVIAAHLDASKLDYIVKFFDRHYWWPESVNDGLYRPIAVLSYGLVYQGIGQFLDVEREAMPQHAVNVLLHVWAVWLVIRLLVVVGAPGFVSLLTALLFGVHAIHSEVVAGIIGRAEIFSFCFGAQAMLWFTRGGWLRIALASLMIFFAFGSKESSFCWVPFWFCFALARQWIRVPDEPVFAALRSPASLIALGAMIVMGGLWFLLRSNAMEFEPIAKDAADFSSNPLAHESFGPRVMTAIKVWGYALLLCVAPFKLSCIYSPHVFDIVRSPLDAGFLTALAALVAFLGAGLWFARRLPLLFLAMSCFLGFSFVTSNVPLAIGTILGERLYYTPSLGVCLLPGVLWMLVGTRGAKILVAAVAMWCAGSIVVALQRTHLWQDSGALFFHDVEVFPEAIDLHRKCAAVYRGDGPRHDIDKAIGHLETAKKLHENYAHAYRELGHIYRSQKKWRKAIAEYERALAVDYTDPPGAETIAFNAIGDCLCGLAGEADDEAEKRRLIDEAMGWYQKSLAAPLWGDKDGESNNKMGGAFVLLAKLESNEENERRMRLRALEWFRKSVDAPEKLKMVSARPALKMLLKHAVEPNVVLNTEQIAGLYQTAHGVVGEDHELTLMMGVAAYKGGLPVQAVFEPLNYALHNAPPDKRDQNFYTAHLFYADALLEMGQAPRAREIFRMLLGRPELEEPIKAKIRANLQNDPRLR